MSALTVDYGQRHCKELGAARRISELAGVPHEAVSLGRSRAARIDEQTPDGMFVRGHNALLLSIAASSSGLGGVDIVTGTLSTDPFPDAAQEYFDRLAAGMEGPPGTGSVRVVAPLRSLADKNEAMLTGFELGAPMHLSWSCRAGTRRACEVCQSCRSRASAVASLPGALGLSEVAIWAWQRAIATPRHPAVGRASAEVEAVARDVMAAASHFAWPLGWRYVGPDGVERVAPGVPPPRHIRRRVSGRVVRMISLVGRAEADGNVWQVVVTADGAIATSGKEPSIAELEVAILESLQSTD